MVGRYGTWPNAPLHKHHYRYPCRPDRLKNFQPAEYAKPLWCLQFLALAARILPLLVAVQVDVIIALILNYGYSELSAMLH
jgi:hypothetical protein